ncbi:MAG TPA: glucosyltransferase domain-containing protein [Steroidobacteraceae bacterium]
MQPTLPKNVVTEPSISVSIGTADVVVERGRVLSGWMLLLTAVLFLVPLLTYWSATFHHFGLRDDYSNIREAHEEVGKVVRFCASHARPIYGWMLQSTFGQVNSVEGLQWLRLMSSLLLGAMSLVSFRGFRALSWSFNASLSFAVLLALVPSSQVIASWAIAWPYAVAALLSFGAFFTIDATRPGSRMGRGRVVRQSLVAIGLLLISALIYQSSAMFYVVPMAAALIVRRRHSARATLRWAAIHLGFVIGTMALAYCTMSELYAIHVFEKSGRVAFEHHWFDKLSWFLSEPLPNALSLFVLNDDNGRDHFWYLACATLAGAILIAGAALEWRRHGRSRGLIWISALVTLPTFAFAISLVASEHYATYRTILAMTAVLLCFLVASVAALTERWTVNSRRLLAGAVATVAYLTAQHHAFALIAVPQGNEWQLIMQAAKRVHLPPPHSEAAKPRIFAIAAALEDLSTSTIYHDEFGSLSTNSEWVPREMFKRAMHELHPEVANLDSRYVFASAADMPADQNFDIIIDLHRLRQFYVNN